MTPTKTTMLCSAAALFCSGVSSAYAQEAAPAAQPAPAEGDGGAGLTDIIVTAQKRSERLQDVPTTINAINADQLRSSGVNGIRDLNAVVPGLTMTSTNGGSFLFLRGVGQSQASIGIEAPVAMYLDGVYLFSHLSGAMSFNDIRQVEVLKGPQGTLFGRNATGGVLQVFTKDPTTELTASGDIGYGNYQTIEARAYVSGGLAKGLTGSIAGYLHNRNKGYGRDIFTGREAYTDNSSAVHAKLRWLSDDDATELTLNGYYDRSKNYGSLNGIFPGYRGADNVTTYIDDYTVAGRYDTPATTIQALGSVRLRHDFDWARIVDIAAYSWMRSFLDNTQNAIPGNLVNPVTHATAPAVIQRATSISKTVSNEFQIQALPDKSIQWVAGLFLIRNESTQDLNVLNNETVTVHTFGDVVTKSIAAFSQATAPITDRLKLTLGVRYTSDNIKFDGLQSRAPVTPAAAGIATDITNSKVSYRAVADYKVTRDIMIFGGYNTGFKAGRFVINNFSNPPLLPETIGAWEAGIKSEFLDRKVRLNVSLFSYHYKNLQLRAAAGASGLPVTVNAAAAKAKGVDVDLTLRPIPRLTISAGAEYIDGQYDSFPAAFCPSYNPVTSAINSNVRCDLSGAKLVRTPTWSGNINVAYEIPTSFGSFHVSASDGWSGRYNFEPDGRLQQPAFHKIGASVSWDSPDGRWGLELWGSNLLNKHIYASAQTSTSFTYTPGDPRLYGVRAKFNF